MPLPLPSGVIPTVTFLTPEESLTVLRVSSYRFDLLSSTEAPLGELAGVRPGGSLDWTASASIKGSGQITVDDVGQSVDWLNNRIRPVAIIDGWPEEVPLGIWLCAAPVENWADEGRSWEVELLDKLSILDQDVYADPQTAEATTYSLERGDNIIEAVRSLIEETGESADAIEVAPETLYSDQMWDVGTTRLRIINDLLDMAGYFSLYVDMSGAFQVSVYAPPAQRPIVYEGLAPFVRGATSIMQPNFTRDADIYAVPNRVVALGQGEGAEEGMTATAVNTDAKSPFSYQARGRWITMVETGVEAVDQAALDTYAQRRLISATSTAASFPIKHIPLPGLTFNSVVRLVDDRAGIDAICTVSQTSWPLDPLELANSKLVEVLDV